MLMVFIVFEGGVLGSHVLKGSYMEGLELFSINLNCGVLVDVIKLSVREPIKLARGRIKSLRKWFPATLNISFDNRRPDGKMRPMKLTEILILNWQ